MTTSRFGDLTVTLVADGDLTSYLYHVGAKSSSAGKVGLATSRTAKFDEAPIGVLVAVGQSDEAVAVAVHGEAKAIVGSAVNYGDMITTNASGRVISAASGDVTFGWAMESGSPGDYIRVFVEPIRRLNATETT